MRRALFAAVGLALAACGPFHHGYDDGALQAGLGDLRYEAERHHATARATPTRDELLRELERHEVEMAAVMGRLRRALLELDCDGGLRGSMAGLDGAMSAHRADVVGAATLEEAKAACLAHRDELVARADDLEVRAWELGCARGGGHMGRW